MIKQKLQVTNFAEVIGIARAKQESLLLSESLGL